jgi:DtxR family manganese transport transcriptional regulator
MCYKDHGSICYKSGQFGLFAAGPRYFDWLELFPSSVLFYFNMASNKGKNSFSITRGRRRTEVVDDYTELIDELLSGGETARIGIIADRLGVSHVTALRATRRLESQGYLVVAERGKGVQLTAKGRKVAERARERHELLESFFVRLGVSAATAANDAEGAEHYLSDETFLAIKRFLGR